MSESLRVTRVAVTSDAADIAKVQIRVWRLAYRGLVTAEYLASLDAKVRAAKWQQWLRNGNTIVSVDRRIVGFCSVGKARDVDFNGSTGEMFALYVEPDSWRCGIGAQLCRTGLSLLRSNGFGRMAVTETPKLAVGKFPNANTVLSCNTC